MNCQICQSDSRVYDSRPAKVIPNAVWRRRECLGCGYRWRTYERNEDEIQHDIAIERATSSLSDLYVLFLRVSEEYGVEWEPHFKKIVAEAEEIVGRKTINDTKS